MLPEVAAGVARIPLEAHEVYVRLYTGTRTRSALPPAHQVFRVRPSQDEITSAKPEDATGSSRQDDGITRGLELPRGARGLRHSD